MISFGFLLTSLVVVLIPGTGVLYTVATGLFSGKRASFFAAFGCTLGIIPALLASSCGLAALFHTSVVAFQVVKYAGAAYLLYLAWQMWRSSSPLSLSKQQSNKQYSSLVIKGFLLNILNPKLSIFFLAFLPQFIPSSVENPLNSMLLLGAVFMLMTFVVFVIYGFLSGLFSAYIIKSEKASIMIQRIFATSFAALALKLVFSERT
ncbi:Homoserine/homoserine lactone efflux protein [Marinomonas spartinae]|uniref:Homoserine/homoserine lactone efflux protein n=1 Tax=Marinomonas spartinae TaxID=1792290 RepID=A0A1A8TVE2_9GAMM|nr:LysE family translocator [Marinomonas spartinae]SBS37738.1 Homoserine/homoserine lactone efflux protein [Marinomonas spartinae]